MNTLSSQVLLLPARTTTNYPHVPKRRSVYVIGRTYWGEELRWIFIPPKYRVYLTPEERATLPIELQHWDWCLTRMTNIRPGRVPDKRKSIRGWKWELTDLLSGLTAHGGDTPGEALIHGRAYLYDHMHDLQRMLQQREEIWAKYGTNPRYLPTKGNK